MTILAANFTESQRALRGADLTGAVDGKRMILSFWWRLDGQDGFIWQPLGNKSNAVIVSRKTNNKWEVELRNASSGQILITESTDTYINDGVWRHFLFSCDLGLGAGISHLYIDDDDQNNETINDDDFIKITSDDHSVGGEAGVGHDIRWLGCLAEVYINYAEYLNFSIVANRRKFISADLKAVPNLGSIPTGTDPIGYFKGDGAGFHINSGTGGNYSQVSGPFSSCSDAPEEAGGEPGLISEDIDAFVDAVL